MNFKEYQEQTKRTCPDLGEKMNLCHMVLGLVSEQEEYIKAFVKNDIVNQKEEVADKFWYLSNYCTFRGYDLQELYDNCADFKLEEWESKGNVYDIHVSKLNDYVKKYIAYNKEIDREKEKNTLKVLLWSLDDTDIFQNVTSLLKALQNNIDKLKVRFPEKFTEENALNRDLDLERKELEK